MPVTSRLQHVHAMLVLKWSYDDIQDYGFAIHVSVRLETD